MKSYNKKRYSGRFRINRSDEVERNACANLRTTRRRHAEPSGDGEREIIYHFVQ